jgi:glycosyltransferase involved in cell wall biosynthesis
LKLAVSVFGDISKARGTIVRARRVASLLSRKYDTTVLTCSNRAQAGPEEIGHAHVMSIGCPVQRLVQGKSILSRLFSKGAWAVGLFFILLKNRFDVVYCSQDWGGFLGIYLASRIRRCKVIYEAHGILSEEAKEQGCSKMGARLRHSWERFVVGHSDHVVALSPNIFEFYRSCNSKIDLIPVFVDDALFIHSGYKGSETHSKSLGLIGPFDDVRQKSTLRFLYSNKGNFDERLSFVVVGRCNERVEDNRIHYTGYLESVKDYVAQLSHLDAVLVPEELATSGPLNKIIEPMSCSIPIFATPKGIMGLYWVESGKDILVFDEDILVDKVNELIFDEELMKQVGRNARKAVEKHYSERVNEERLIKIVESVAGT